MFRSLLSSALRVSRTCSISTALPGGQRTLSTLISKNPYGFRIPFLSSCNIPPTCQLLTKQPSAMSPVTLPLLQQQPMRSLTKFSLNKGKRKSVRAVIKRFKRLHWGIWIRTHCGRHKKMYKKSPERRRRLRQHIFTNSTQSYLLDKMVTNFWRRPKYYVDDPYEPYHTRDEFFATQTKKFKV